MSVIFSFFNSLPGAFGQAQRLCRKPGEPTQILQLMQKEAVKRLPLFIGYNTSSMSIIRQNPRMVPLL